MMMVDVCELAVEVFLLALICYLFLKVVFHSFFLHTAQIMKILSTVLMSVHTTPTLLHVISSSKSRYFLAEKCSCFHILEFTFVLLLQCFYSFIFLV